jgi:tripartite-type tricarboxylate transporter receptor subunit TctC
MSTRRSLLATCLAALCGGAIGATTPAIGANDYPNRPIMLVVPYPAGGGNDIVARAIAEKMSRILGQQVVVDNRGGAGGTLGTRQVARSAPDGYTLGLAGTGTFGINPTLYTNVGYDPRTDFTPIGPIASAPMIVLVHPSLPANSINDLIALANKTPGKINYASAGSGTAMHLAAELFAGMSKTSFTHIPYRGTGPAIGDLLGGHVSLFFSSLAPAISIVKDGKVRPLAMTGGQRSRAFPDLPLVSESGVPGYEATQHYGLVAPAGTPPEIVQKLSAALRTALESEEVRARIETDGAEPFSSTPAEYAAYLDREERKWSAIVRQLGLKN